MNIEELRLYCLSLPETTEDMAFGEDYLLIRVCGRIFACIGLTRTDYFVVKCDPDYALELRDHYAEIEPAWHWNKRYWNQLCLHGSLSEDFIKALIRHSYSEVAKKLTKKEKAEHPHILDINQGPFIKFFSVHSRDSMQ